tara:strand:+ start:199 stop:399 length:201 start_codon:yes stop_codon:yes gene_type:complete
MKAAGKKTGIKGSENVEQVYQVPSCADERMIKSINDLNAARQALFSKFKGDPGRLKPFHGCEARGI